MILITIKDFFTCLKRCMESYLDPLIKILLKKSTDTNSFISDEADAALMAMTKNCQDTKVLNILILHSNQSKASAFQLRICKCLAALVESLGNSILFFKDNDKLISALASYMSDANQEVRSTAKQSFKGISQAIMDSNELEKLLQRVLNEQKYKKVRTFLD